VIKKLLIALVSLVFLASCATMQDIKVLEDKIQKQSRTDTLQALEGSAGTKMYGRVARTGTNSLATLSHTGLLTGDQCIVMDSSLDIYFYKYDSTSALANNDPWVIQPTVPTSPATGRWLLARGLVLKNDDTNQSYIRFYEDYTTGQNYYELLAPSSILANSSFYLGRWRVSAVTLTGSSTNLAADTTYDTLTNRLYYVTTTGLTGNYGISLPPATGSGAVIGVHIVDDSASFRFILEPNGTDRIMGPFTGTNADGDYVYAVGKYVNTAGDIVASADTTGQSIMLVDAASGRWAAIGTVGEWAWE